MDKERLTGDITKETAWPKPAVQTIGQVDADDSDLSKQSKESRDQIDGQTTDILAVQLSNYPTDGIVTTIPTSHQTYHIYKHVRYLEIGELLFFAINLVCQSNLQLSSLYMFLLALFALFIAYINYTA